MPKNNKSNRKKLTIISVVTLGVALLIVAGFYIFNLVNGDQYYLKPLGWTTYQNTNIPFKFDYPSSWSLETGSSNNQTTLTASSDGKNIVSIAYNIADGPIAEGASAVDPDCRNKQARSVRLEDACSYIANSSMRNGYFYNNVGSDMWSGEYTRTIITENQSTKEQLVSIVLSLLDDSSSSKNDLASLAKSIKPVSK